ncbi:VanZ family protein [Alkalibacter rhizosphaerae]|uniref:VanZ family protein n=1 Tax=Alkalibacter rhizosphaerae TaxID=2815577 RepID=A0A974XJ07_9FIRM|nr:VanZ family protein [Alkalibacter rhizosphaerae]QSX09605.1 VanZ family protein [Alkalibacter rhizosphaerae]
MKNRSGTNKKWNLAVLSILLVTLVPFRFEPGGKRILNLVPFRNMVEMIFASKNLARACWNIGVNVALFIPFGYLTGKDRGGKEKSFVDVALMGFVFSMAIEVIQYVLPTGRSADIDDVILNTLGTCLGYAVWKVEKDGLRERKNELR